jgi:hypothetical protein
MSKLLQRHMLTIRFYRAAHDRFCYQAEAGEAQYHRWDREIWYEAYPDGISRLPLDPTRLLNSITCIQLGRYLSAGRFRGFFDALRRGDKGWTFGTYCYQCI